MIGSSVLTSSEADHPVTRTLLGPRGLEQTDNSMMGTADGAVVDEYQEFIDYPLRHRLAGMGHPDRNRSDHEGKRRRLPPSLDRRCARRLAFVLGREVDCRDVAILTSSRSAVS